MNKIVKNQEYIVEIIDNGYQAEGIAKIDDYTVFIPNTIKGEKVKNDTKDIKLNLKKLLDIEKTS